MKASDQGNLWQATAAQAAQPTPLAQDADCDLVIVGGGFTGCSAALHAAEAGLSVRLLEAETIGHGGSGRNVGLVNAGLWLPPEEVEARIGRAAGARLNADLAAAPDLVFDLIDRHGIACDAVRAGTLHCASSPRHLAGLQARHRQNADRGAPVRLLDRKEIGVRTGSALYHGALFDPRAGTIQPLSYCRGLADAARRAGAVLHEHSLCTAVSREAEQWVVTCGPNRVRAPMLLIASNAYGQGCAGISPSRWSAVHYFQAATQVVAPDLLNNILPGQEGCWDTALVMSSFRRDAQGRILIGGIGNPGHFAGGIHRAWLRRKLAQIYPQLAGLEIEYLWQGRIAMTGDHIPKIQRLGPGGYSVFGYSGRGIGPGTAFGRALAQCFVTGEEENLPVAPVNQYDEGLLRTKATYYETGALGAHALAAR